MPDTGYISIPLFTLVILAELMIGLREHPGLHGKRDTVNNILLGLILVGTGIVFKLLSLNFFLFVHSFAIFDFENSAAVWILAIILCDLVYYFFHWLGHYCRIFWAYHAVHHSSEYYNYSVGIRNHFIHITFRYIFWSPLCLLGFDPFMVIFIDNCTNLYQFLLHTRLIGKLGILEYVINTPSHHRVHHAANEMYIDKNFGGFFILFDRLFGTFCEEKEQPVFGVTSNKPGYNIGEILFNEYRSIWYHLKYCNSLKSKVVYLFTKPGK